MKNSMRLSFVIVLLAGFLIASAARAYGSYGPQLPPIALSALTGNDCEPIEGFYARSDVYLPSFSFLESWQGESLIAAACQSVGERKTYKIVLARPSYEMTGEGQLTKAPTMLNCPREITLQNKPHGARLTIRQYDPQEKYHAEHMFSGLDTGEPMRFLVIQNLRMWGEGEEYVCMDGEWKTFVIH